MPETQLLGHSQRTTELCDALTEYSHCETALWGISMLHVRVMFAINKSVSQLIPLSFILSRNESIHDISESHLLHFKYSCSTSVNTDFKQRLWVSRKNKCSTLCMQDSITTDSYGENAWFAVLRSTLKRASTEVAVLRVQFCLVIFVFHYNSNLLEYFVDTVVAPQPSLLELP